MIQAKYSYIKGKGWLGVIFDDSIKMVLTVGSEDTEEQIKRWCKGSVASMRNGGKELSDRTDRRIKIYPTVEDGVL